MSASDLTPFVAEVIRDTKMPELVAEKNALRAELDEERRARRLVEIVGRDGTVFATGTLEGATVDNDEGSPCPGTISVGMTMVEGVRTCKKNDFQDLSLRIGGIPSIYKLSGGLSETGAFVRDFTFIEESLHLRDSDKYHLFLGWPTKLFLALMLQFTPDERAYPIKIDGRHLEVDGLSFGCGPRISGRAPVDNRGNLLLSNDDIEEVVFRSVTFASYVGERSSSFSFLSTNPRIREFLTSDEE